MASSVHIFGVGPEAWLNQRLCCFRPLEGIPEAFVRYSIEQPLAFFERSKTGTTVIHLGKADIDTFRVVVPPASTMREFGKIVNPLDARIVAIGRESRTLAAIRDALLPRLISGELRALQPTQIRAEDSWRSPGHSALRADRAR